MSKKCSTAQRFIRTEMTTYRIGTLILSLLYRLHGKMNIAVAILGKCDNYPNCIVSKNIYPDSCFDADSGGSAKQTFINTEERLSGALLRPGEISLVSRVNPNKDLGLFVIKTKDWAAFYDSNIIRSFCSKKLSRGYRVIYRYNISG